MAKARKYTLRRRAERQEETRRRIVEAAVALHQSVGPARTTVSAVAERAGVDRHTVYSHFPDLRSLFGACAGYGRATWPWPDPGPWRGIRDPSLRLRTALGEVYAYYRETEQIWSNVLRDAEVMPLLREFAGEDMRYLAELRSLLAGGWGVRGKRRRSLVAALGLALDFGSWRTLARVEGLSDAEAADLMTSSVRAQHR